MKLETKLKQLLNNQSEIEIVAVLPEHVEIRLPYENGLIYIDLEGESDEERIESFKEGVNHRLQDMINHLGDCKLD